MELILLFATGFLLSFIGTIPPGMINLSIAQTSIYKGFKMAQAAALGAALVELFQALVALKLAWIFTAKDSIIPWVAVVVFLCLSIYFAFFAPKSTEIKEKNYKSEGFFKGALISFLNVMTYPYWIFWGTYLKRFEWFSSDWISTLAFISGASLATFILLNVYALLGQNIVKRVASIAQITNKVLAVVFFLLAILQLIQVLGILKMSI